MNDNFFPYSSQIKAQTSYLWLLSIFTLSPLCAQVEIKNGSFDEWTYDDGGDYYEPTGYWATANPISKLSAAAPVTTFRETERVFAGEYAAKMVTGLLGTLPVSGSIYSGEFIDTAISDPSEAVKLGVPYTDRPSRFSGYYMYFPVAMDSAAIVCQFTKFENGEQILVGQGALVVYEEVDSYTLFDLEIEYFSSEEPDTMSVAFSSSAAGRDFIGNEGSTLYIDEVKYEFTTGHDELIFSDHQLTLFPNPSNQNIQLHLSETGGIDYLFHIWDEVGQFQQANSITETHSTINTQHLQSGIYFYQLTNNGRFVNGGKFEIIR